MDKTIEKKPLDLYTKQELADLLGVAVTTVYKYTLSGVFKSYNFGGRRIFYKRDEVMAALNEIEYKK